MTPEESRKEFEAWIVKRLTKRFLERFSTGEYAYGDVRLAWEAWQAAREK